MTDPELNPFDILNAIEIPVPVGKTTYVGGRVCFAMMFFLSAQGDGSIPARLVRAEARVREVFGTDCYDFWTAQEPFRPTPVKTTPPPDLGTLHDDFVANDAQSKTGAFNFKLWTGRRDGKAPPTQMVSYFYERAHEQEAYAEYDMAETFQVNIPLPTIEEMNQPSFLQQLFASLCEILRPLSAVGGLCLATPLSAAVLQDRQHLLYPLLNTHPGLLVGQALDMAAGTRFRMSAVNWLTAVHADLLDLCGGADEVRGALSLDGFHTKDFADGGLLIQAGPSPQGGDTTQGIGIPHYGELARALEPARLQFEGRIPHVPAYGPEDVLYAPDLLAKTQNAWLARFDHM
ncbi:hypothetical protein Z945_3307 [Sulfitobacter noctilucae]|uniref:type VI immunity family protein n=1 Tax=Sulfitobacter noctilucae TaxID=1342302 RepID=UPI00046A3767|nr:type VI immunity family protein [Sulfitobacter noctilucae]KIN70843.1 hypothetical protein Z945_3307 [Sulfitobacter noctilucae]